MLSDKIKDELFFEVSAIYANAQPELTEKDIRERIDVFAIILHYALDDQDVQQTESISTSLEYEVSDLLILAKRQPFTNIKEKTVMLEAYLKLLCFYVDRERIYA